MTQLNVPRGKFITLEGIEGVGKSTVAEKLYQFMLKNNIDAIKTREPGGTPIAETIRQIILKKFDEVMTIDAELLLFFAGRAQHLANLILPALNQGQWVICDRFTDASFAYQGSGRGIDINRIEVLENWVLGDFRPDLTILLDAPVATGRERMKNRRSTDRIEKEASHFFEKIRQGYLKRAKLYPERYAVIDAAKQKKIVHKNVIDTIINSFRLPLENPHV